MAHLRYTRNVYNQILNKFASKDEINFTGGELSYFTPRYGYPKMQKISRSLIVHA
jgi:hypothetical protein